MKYLKPGLMRLILAEMVVVSHLSNLNIGRLAVIVFFVLSGYWVYSLYEKKVREKRSLLNFYLSRAMRIWLPFASSFVLTYLTFRLLKMPVDLDVLRGLSLLGLASTGTDILGTSWSLDIEIQFYIAIPLIYGILNRELESTRGSILKFFALAVLTCLGWALYFFSSIWTFLMYLPAFSLGIAVHLYKPKCNVNTSIGSLTTFILAFASFYFLDMGGVIKGKAEFIEAELAAFALVLVLMPLIVWNLNQKGGKFDRHLGNLSFSIYITHWPIISISTLFIEEPSKLQKLFLITIIFIVAVIFYILIDRNWERLRARTNRLVV